IGHGKTPEIAPSAVHKSAIKSIFAYAVLGKGRTLQLLYRLADFERSSRRRQPLAKAHGHRIRHAPRHLPQETIALITENAAPYAMKIYGHDWRFNTFDNPFHAATEGQQLSGARDLPFSKDAYNFAVTNSVTGGAQ